MYGDSATALWYDRRDFIDEGQMGQAGENYNISQFLSLSIA